MTQLTINPSYLQMLILKVRALMAREEADTSDPESNPSEDEASEALQEIPGDLAREEVIEEIEGLGPTEQAELVALMWIGRGDNEPEEWEELLKFADERREVATSTYLLDHPLVADHWAEALDKLGYGGMVEGVEEI